MLTASATLKLLVLPSGGVTEYPRIFEQTKYRDRQLNTDTAIKRC